MASRCAICNKEVIFGSSITHSNKKNNRAFKPNIQKIRVRINGSVKKIKVCTRCMKSNKVTKVV